MPKISRTLLALTLLAGAALVFLKIKGLPPFSGGAPAGVIAEAPRTLPPYPEALGEIDRQRRELAGRLRLARGGEREAILDEARALLERSVAADLPAYWLGTRWDFNGVSQVPGEGQIACGYFVSTLLRDSGFEVERVRLAQQASGNIIRSLTTPENTTRLVGRSFDEFLQALREAGEGIFVIGLDNHVGFIAQTANGARFIHSDGGRNRCVVSEPVETAPTLRRSRWREFANLSADDALLQKWLLGGRFPTVVRL